MSIHRAKVASHRDPHSQRTSFEPTCDLKICDFGIWLGGWPRSWPHGFPHWVCGHEMVGLMRSCSTAKGYPKSIDIGSLEVFWLKMICQTLHPNPPPPPHLPLTPFPSTLTPHHSLKPSKKRGGGVGGGGGGGGGGWGGGGGVGGGGGGVGGGVGGLGGGWGGGERKNQLKNLFSLVKNTTWINFNWPQYFRFSNPRKTLNWSSTREKARSYFTLCLPNQRLDGELYINADETGLWSSQTRWSHFHPHKRTRRGMSCTSISGTATKEHADEVK